MRTIDVRADSAAPPQAVWDLLADIETWSSWGAFDESVLERPAQSADPRGVGAIRRFRTGRIRNQEEMVRVDPPYALSCEVRESDVPVRDYHADVELSARPGSGAAISWRSTFRPRWPGIGRLVERRLGAFIADSAQRLARAAEAAGQR